MYNEPVSLIYLLKNTEFSSRASNKKVDLQRGGGASYVSTLKNAQKHSFIS